MITDKLQRDKKQVLSSEIAIVHQGHISDLIHISFRSHIRMKLTRHLENSEFASKCSESSLVFTYPHVSKY